MSDTASRRRRETRRPTMRQVAETAGVSVQTVSRVVNGQPHVAADTSARVQAAIVALGFRRDEVARSLRLGHRMHMVGLIVSDMANPFVTALAHGVEDTVRKRGRALVVANSDDDHEQERELITDLLRRRIEGLVVVPAGSVHTHLGTFAQGVPMVFAHRPVEGVMADVVLPDDFGAASRGVAELLRRGHRRIAFLGDHSYIHNIQERMRGFRAAHRKAKVLVDEELVITGSHTAESAQHVATDLIERSHPPTAVFASNNLNCLGTLVAVSRARAKIEVLGFDELPLAEFFNVPSMLLTYDQGDIGRIAADLLIDRIEGRSDPVQRIVVPVASRTAGGSR